MVLSTCTSKTGCCVRIPLRVGSLAIAFFSMVESIIGIVVLSTVAYWIWVVTHAAVNSGIVDGGSNAMKWHQEMFGGLVVMALVDFFIAIFAGVLIYGIRNGERGYMQPWMMVEASKDLIYLFIGIITIPFSPTWGAYIADVAAAAAAGNGLPPTLTTDSMTYLCRSIGLILIIYAGVFIYFLTVVISYYKVSKKGAGLLAPEDQVRPMMAGY